MISLPDGLTNPRHLAVGWAAGRILYAVGTAVAPKRFAGPWLGRGLDTGGGRVAARALVARDGLAAAGVASAALQGHPVRPWIAACVGGDLADVAATMADRNDLPERSPALVLAVAGVTAAAGVAIAVALDS